MPTKLFLILSITILATAGVRVHDAFGQSDTPPKLPVLSPGVHNQSLARPGEATIQYAISVPAGYSPSKPVPLVLALHFGGSPTGAGGGVLNILVRPALEELGAIIVAPDSVGGQWSTAENERAVNLLLDGVLNAYNVDRKKIVVTGFSMGGAGTWHFANKYPERFSAAVPVAGRPTPPNAGWRLPVFAVHSRNDEVVPIGPAETRIAELKKAGVRAEMIVLTGITHYETNRFVDGLRKAVPWLKETWK
jgi:predicted peptidase